MDSPARKAMFRNMVTSLLLHEQIRTTTERAKELRKYADRVISIGKRAPREADLESLSGETLKQARADRVAAIRRIKRWVNNDEVVARVMGEYAERFQTRPGGYTRVMKLGRRRPGDNAAMAVIQLVGPLSESSVRSSSDDAAPVAATGAAEE
jgi:large subunit ribosomal protein L17